MPKVHDFPYSRQIGPPNNLLAQAFRLAEDIEQRHARIIARCLGGGPKFIMQAGYRVVSGAFVAAFRAQGLELPSFVAIRQTILLPCFNKRGEIAGLHDQNGNWLLGPVPHVANAKRARWEPVRIYRSISQADSIALAENVCCVVPHGLDITDLLSHLNGQDCEVAA